MLSRTLAKKRAAHKTSNPLSPAEVSAHASEHWQSAKRSGQTRRRTRKRALVKSKDQGVGDTQGSSRHVRRTKGTAITALCSKKALDTKMQKKPGIVD